MKHRRYYGYMYTIIYLMILRIVLHITVGINVFSLGTIFDLVLMMFWVGVFAFFMRSLLAQKIYYIFVVIASAVFVIGDSVYYDYFETISAKSSFSGLKWLAEGNTLEYDITIPLVAYLMTPLIIGVIVLIIRNKKKDTFFMKDFAYLSLVFVVQVVLFLVWGNYEFDTRYEFYRSDAYLFESMYDRSRFSEKYGYYNYHMLDFTRLRPKPDAEALFEEVDAYFDEQEEHGPNAMSDTYQGYNLITIVGETLETRFIDPVLTPNLYMMKTNGIHFDNFYTTVWQQGATCNSEFMSLTGLNATSSNDWSSNICDAYTDNPFTYSLPNQLKTQGYDTYYFHSGFEWFYNRLNMVPNYGFETIKFQEDIYELGYTEEEFVDRFDTDMLTFFDEYVTYEEPFMITLLTYSGHGAYNQVEFEIHNDQVNAAHPGEELDPEIRNYMQKLVEFDTMLGLIMMELENEGVLDNTLFTIYPDHYPYMMDEDTYSEYIGVEYRSHEIMHQDLIMYAPGMTPQTVSNVGSTIDIAPTLLNMLFSDGEFGYFMGTDLFSDDDNYVLFSDLTITDGDNFLYLNEELFGDELQYGILEQALEAEITALEIQKKLLNSNYFRMKEDEE